MNEQDFYSKLDEINKHVIAVENAVKPKLWRSFLDGMLRGIGSILGVAIALTVIGWVLNIVGVIPALKDRVDEWQNLIDRATPASKSIQNRVD